MPGCRVNNEPLTYTANLSATSTLLELLAVKGLTKENKLNVLNQCPPRDADKCHTHLGLRATQSGLEHLECLQRGGWVADPCTIKVIPSTER